MNEMNEIGKKNKISGRGHHCPYRAPNSLSSASLEKGRIESGQTGSGLEHRLANKPKKQMLDLADEEFIVETAPQIVQTLPNAS